MTSPRVSFRTTANDGEASIAVDLFAFADGTLVSGEIFLEVSESGVDGDLVTTILTPKRARKLGKALIRAAKNAKGA